MAGRLERLRPLSAEQRLLVVRNTRPDWTAEECIALAAAAEAEASWFPVAGAILAGSSGNAPQSPRRKAAHLEASGRYSLLRGHLAAARANLAASAARYRELGDRHAEGRALVALARAWSRAGEPARSVGLLIRAARLVDPGIDRDLPARLLLDLAASCAAAGRAADAASVLAEARPALERRDGWRQLPRSDCSLSSPGGHRAPGPNHDGAPGRDHAPTSVLLFERTSP